MENSTPDCREVLAKLYVYIDREIAGADCAAIEAHFAECDWCLKHADFERAVKAMVARKCGHEDVPSGLVERLRARFRSGD